MMVTSFININEYDYKCLIYGLNADQNSSIERIIYLRIILIQTWLVDVYAKVIAIMNVYISLCKTNEITINSFRFTLNA